MKTEPSENRQVHANGLNARLLLAMNNSGTKLPGAPQAAADIATAIYKFWDAPDMVMSDEDLVCAVGFVADAISAVHADLFRERYPDNA